MTVSDLQQVRAEFQLKEAVHTLTNILPTLQKFMSEGHHIDLCRLNDLILELESVSSTYNKQCLSICIARLDGKQKDRTPLDLIRDATKELTDALPDMGRQKDDPYLVLAAFDLLQSVMAVVWTIGAAKSRDIWGMSKACFSKQGWDKYRDAQLAVADLHNRRDAE